MKCLIRRLLGAALLSAGMAGAACADVVHTAQGDVAGVAANAVESFKGIPFAAPPVGDLRWRPPAPAASWTGVRQAKDFGPICEQPTRPGGPPVKISEDCLTLNVWRPAGAKPGAKLPVMVWIYGGGFIIGGAATPTYDGTHFAQKGVVLVSLNYRVGRFGFFAHPALDGGPGPVGNYGIMDQIAALQWVQANAAAFGGDPANVTVFGESAGAISVNYLMGAPAAKGLFAKAISESGFGRSPPRPLPAAEAAGTSFAEAQGIKGNDAAAAAALRALPVDKLLAGVTGLGDPGVPAPINDGQVIRGSAADVFAKGDEAHVPYLEGGNSYEASLFEPVVAAHPDVLIGRAGDPAKVTAIYGGGPSIDVARGVMTDTMIGEPDRFLARQMAKQGLPAFVYHFSYVPASMRDKVPGARHGGEVPYVFDTLNDAPVSFGGFTLPAATRDDHAIADAMQAYWVAFAKTSDPGSAGGPAWPRYTVGTDQLLQFGADGVHPRTDFQKARLDLIEGVVTGHPGG